MTTSKLENLYLSLYVDLTLAWKKDTWFSDTKIKNVFQLSCRPDVIFFMNIAICVKTYLPNSLVIKNVVVNAKKMWSVSNALNKLLNLKRLKIYKL